MKNRSTRTITILSLIIAIAALTVGFASLTTTISIRGNTLLKGNVFNVHFKDAIDTTDSRPSNSGKITSGPTLASTSTSLVFSIELIKAGDEASFTVNIKNAGKINTSLSNIQFVGKEEMLAKDIIYTVTYADGTPLRIGDDLLKNTEKKILVKVKYKEGSTIVFPSDETFDVGINLVYHQKNEM